MNDWLKNLKVGDKVIVSCRMGDVIRTVEKITPAGNIKVNGTLFNSNGLERGGDTWNMTYLHEATPEAVQKVTNKNIIQKAINLMRNTTKITPEQAKAIIAVLNHPTEKGSVE